MTTYLPRYAASDVAAPEDEISGTSGIGTVLHDALAGGRRRAGHREFPQAANTGESAEQCDQESQ